LPIYFLVATLYLAFVVFVAVSRYGSVKLGPEHSTPDYGVFSWAAMLFAAGIGIDLMFFSVAGPVSHYLAPPGGEGQTVEAARQAVVWTLFHYGITGWSMYALMGLALAYFSFRYRLPLAIRSALYPSSANASTAASATPWTSPPSSVRSSASRYHSGSVSFS